MIAVICPFPPVTRLFMTCILRGTVFDAVTTCVRSRAGVEGVRGARQECDVDLVVTGGLGGIPQRTAKGSRDTIRDRKCKMTRAPVCFFHSLS